MLIAYHSEAPVQYTEDITTAGTCTDQPCYDSKSFYSDRDHEDWLEILRAGKLASWRLLVNQARKQSRLPIMHSASLILEIYLALSDGNQP